jgi:hypothetical protein
MAERSSWATQDSGPTGTLDVEDTRLGTNVALMAGSTAIAARSGFRPDGAAQWGYVFATSPTPNGFVHVSPFSAVLQTVRNASGGAYTLILDAQKDINVLSTPADGTNPRNDLIIAQQSDTFYGDANSNWTIRQVVGTPAGSPSDPAVSGSTDYIPLARVRVNAGATSVSQANITDLRTSGHAKSLTGGKFTVAAGGLLPIEDATAEASITGKFPGMQIWRIDLKRRHTWDGSNWMPDPGTILGSFERTTAKTFVAGSPTVALALTLTGIVMKNGYDYEISTGTLRLVAVSGETAQAQLHGDLTGAAPTVSSAVYQAAEGNPNTAFAPAQSATINRRLSCTSDATTGWALSIGRSGGSGNTTLDANSTRPIQLMVRFLGPTPSSTGTAP